MWTMVRRHPFFPMGTAVYCNTGNANFFYLSRKLIFRETCTLLLDIVTLFFMYFHYIHILVASEVGIFIAMQRIS